MCKLLGQNRVLIAGYAYASTANAIIWSYVFPGPGFTQIGTMSGQNTLTFANNNYPIENMIHDPVRNRVLMINNYIYSRQSRFPERAAWL